VHSSINGVPIDGTWLSQLVRCGQKRNLRVWLGSATNDLDVGAGGDGHLFRSGGLPLNNIMLANALKGRGYDFRFRFGEGHHTFAQAAVDLPTSLAWLWRDYDPDRSEQAFEQEMSERERPLYRVRLANRED
jgi:hypothetical protein